MKFLYLFINFVYFVITVFGDQPIQLTKLCPNECAIIKECTSLQKTTGKLQYKIFPPEGELGQCFCVELDNYLNCANCGQKKKNKAEIDRTELSNACSLLGPPTTEKGGLGLKSVKNKTNTANNNNTANQNNNNNNNNTNLNNNNNKNATSTDNGTNNKSGGKSSGSKIGIIVIAVVAAVAVAGFFVYTRKQKERPESMPFFGNSASSPNQYATLGTPKDISTSNLTTDYNTQFYPNVDTTNQFDTYNNNPNPNPNYGGGYDQPQDYNNQYNPNYQTYNNQYGNYENEIATTVPTTVPTTIPTTVPTTVPTNVDSTQYESRRESMMPGSQPTVTNFNGAFVCAYKYDPQLDDELQLQVNDQVQIIEEYEDGWMKAVNLTTGKEGMAPRVCIKEA